MAQASSVMKIPEIFVFLKALALGVTGAEVFRVAYYLGCRSDSYFKILGESLQIFLVLFGVVVCGVYAWRRGVCSISMHLVRSRRIDLFLTMVLGVWLNFIIAPLLDHGHKHILEASPQWAPAILLALLLILVSAITRSIKLPGRPKASPLCFLADDEVVDPADDALGANAHAIQFAEAVLASGAHSGLVFGIDGGWGVGKTSFVNLAQRRWEVEDVIVFRFEPLRYASDPDLSERFIRDLAASIQRKAYAPEFRPVVSRYSKMMKGKADVSFLGFKISLEPASETVDELLDDVDEVLKRIKKRIIVVIDDLDRLEPKAVNNVLFVVRRTLRLSQAAYVLCYDTEVLVGGKEDAEKAREFLEKFVTVKLNLFVDGNAIRQFLIEGWKRGESQLGLVTSEDLVKLASILSALADLVTGSLAPEYQPLLGNLRKVKRFVNAVLLMKMERADLSRTDFNRQDLINLVLLHLNYPGVFRRLYAEESEGRSGIFCVRRDPGVDFFVNSEKFSEFVELQDSTCKFLLREIFDCEGLRLGDTEEGILRSRACFNEGSYRNLEKYLKFIVRFSIPAPKETFVLYEKAVARVVEGESISSVLDGADFQLVDDEGTHEQFWQLLVAKAYQAQESIRDDAVYTLIDYLPRYSSASIDNNSWRHRAIYTLARLLDKLAWEREGRVKQSGQAAEILLGQRIFGHEEYKGKAVIDLLVSHGRGLLGWRDLMLFRLTCSMDRGGQLSGLSSALIHYGDPKAATSGAVVDLAISQMRQVSQAIFCIFRRDFIESGVNFFQMAESLSLEMVFGESDCHRCSENGCIEFEPIWRSLVKFIIYQLANTRKPTGAGVGCGFYDEVGRLDCGGIGKSMNEYLFGQCFNPDVNESGFLYFVDYCLSSFTSSLDLSGAVREYGPSEYGLFSGLDRNAFLAYWERYGERIKSKGLDGVDRLVVMPEYTVSYADGLPRVIGLLDELARIAVQTAPSS